MSTSTKDTNPADIATNYDPDDENTPTDAPDPNRGSKIHKLTTDIHKLSTFSSGVFV